jgi:formylglycine-generating enzyme required for sulfatase activity
MGNAPEGAFTNSLGMDMVPVAAGEFIMGSRGEALPESVTPRAHLRHGDVDERPAHRVTLSAGFHLSATEVTNAQYEAFDPSHRELRGKLGFSTGDDEAVVFVTWDQARRFCEWLAEREGLPYRLPTEAEWEHACRAGTATPYWTGAAWPEAYGKNQRRSWYPDPARSSEDEVVELRVGQTPANPWGLLDMHGNVEEWCADWYAPYPVGDRVDPVGPDDGEFRVTRGGSHSTEAYYLRSANRMGALPGERSWYIGFRVALGEPAGRRAAPTIGLPLHQRDVAQATRRPAPTPDEPWFAPPLKYVHIPSGSQGPLWSHHNHVPAVVECPNGDLLAAWYSCVEESGRETSVVASRLRLGADEWEPAELMWDAPDRTEESNAFYRAGDGTLFQWICLSAAATWGNCVIVQRTSTDNGATWSPGRIITPDHGLRHMPIDGVIQHSSGAIVIPCDAVTGGHGGTALQVSTDGGETWSDPGGKAAGIHAGIVETDGGRILALGRGDDIDGHMPLSLTGDLGATWEYRASPFPPIRGGQRLALIRLAEGPLFFASFADEIVVPGPQGDMIAASGLFAALSYDEGESWTIARLISDESGDEHETTDGATFTMSTTSAEPRGYLTAIQDRGSTIHLLSSRQHYRFNLPWLEERIGRG